MSDIKLSEHLIKNQEYKIKSYTFMTILILIVIGFIFMIGMFGPDFFALTIFLFIFSIPVILLFKQKIANILPKFVSDKLLEIDDGVAPKRNIKFNISTYVKEIAHYIIICVILIGSGIFLKKSNSDFTDNKCIYKIFGALILTIISGIILLEIN